MDPVRIKSEIIANGLDSRIRGLVRPNSVAAARASSRYMKVRAVTLVWTVGNVVGPHQTVEQDIFAGDVVNGRIGGLDKRHCPSTVRDGLTADSYDDAFGAPGDRDGMIRIGIENSSIFHGTSGVEQSGPTKALVGPLGRYVD